MNSFTNSLQLDGSFQPHNTLYIWELLREKCQIENIFSKYKLTVIHMKQVTLATEKEKERTATRYGNILG